MTQTVVPIAPDLFTGPPDKPQLIGSTCTTCGATTFPVQEHCPRCGQSDMERCLLPTRGTLVTWTTQGFYPKGAYASDETEATFQPFGVGLVQLGDQVRVETRLTVCNPAELQFGMEVELVLEPFRTENDGTKVVTFAFAPVQNQESGDSR